MQQITTPEWVKDAVFYQIFPDRFAQSPCVQKSNCLQPWGSQPTPKGYQGGDLLGVVEHLDYIQDLGVNALYFNPIFQSACNHRYHTHDYYQVDPMLGGNTALRELVTEAHKRGIRVVLDGVFNHASRGFFQFNDILEQGAASAYLDWFTVEAWPLHPYDGSKPANYVAWYNLRDLPKFNTDTAAVREFLMGVGEYWVREFEIDGWRLDVAAEITTPGFWEEFRSRVKTINPEAYIVAEIWEEAQEWLQGDRFDATMNYEWTAAAIAFTAGERVSIELVKDRSYTPYPALDAAGYSQAIQRLLGLYDWNITQVQMNLLDSHDTARYLSIARGDKASVRLGTLLQMTYPGAPSIYYGDEICIRGSHDTEKPLDDSEARWAFPWEQPDTWDTEMLAYMKAAIALRNGHPALRRGRYQDVLAEGDVYVFARQDEQETLLVAVNVGMDAQTVTCSLSGIVEGEPQLQRAFGDGEASIESGSKLTLTLAPRGGAVWSL